MEILIYWFMKAIAKKTLGNPNALAKLLMKSEHGWANSLGKLATSLSPEEKTLKSLLWSQANDEHKHGNMLASIIKAPKTKGIYYIAGGEKVDAVASYIFPLQKILKRSLDTYSLEDRLAFGFWVEVAARNFYKALAEEAQDLRLKNIAIAIAKDEIGHKDYIFKVLIERLGITGTYLLIVKWGWNFLRSVPSVIEFTKELS